MAAVDLRRILSKQNHHHIAGGNGQLAFGVTWGESRFPSAIHGQGFNVGTISAMAFDRDQIRSKTVELASMRIFIGTSSWKYPGWRGMLYDESRYVYRGKFAVSRFEKNCVAEYAEVLAPEIPKTKITQKPKQS